MKLLFVALVIIGYLHLGYCVSESSVSEPLHVTLVAFSGLPDPQWTISPNDPNYQNIQELLSNAGNEGLALLPEQMPAQLGYKGFLVREEGQESAVLILGPKTKELQQNLLKTAPTKELVPGDLEKLIEAGSVLPVDLEKSRTKRVAPDYDGAIMGYLRWNNCYTRPRNNCYNYANNRRTNTFAKPGRGSHSEPAITKATLTGNLVKDYAKNDGLIEIPTAVGAPIPVVAAPARHLVALVIRPGVKDNAGNWKIRPDFHWYRQDSNERWSHKPGRTRRTNLDNSGNEITDPRTANRGRYSEFVCFMSTDTNTITIA